MLRLISSLLALLGGASAAAATCAPLEFDEIPFTICSFDASKDDIRLFHADPSGRPYRHFYSIQIELEKEGKELLFAMNAGMYHSDLAPVGLYIEDGKSTASVVTKEGPGNFGMIPNGVFCIGDGSAQVIETRKYTKVRPACRYATQSGPMLVIEGELHPRFIPGGTSINIRNGVGVEQGGKIVHFAISDERVNFETFGRLFRDVLDTPNALYFDGKVSRLLSTELDRSDGGFAVGPMVGVVVPEE